MPNEFCPPYCGGVKGKAEPETCTGCYYSEAVHQDGEFTDLVDNTTNTATHKIGKDIYDSKGIGHHVRVVRWNRTNR